MEINRKGKHMKYNPPRKIRNPFYKVEFTAESPTIEEAIRGFRIALKHLEEINSSDVKKNASGHGMTSHGNYSYTLKDMSKELAPPINLLHTLY